MSSSKDSLSLFDLTDLISHSSSTTLFPNEDTLLSHLQSRFRADLPYTRIGATTLVSVNPLKVLANVNDATAKEYIERSYKETQSNGPPMQPHLYDLAAKVYLLMTRRHAPQTVLFRGVTGSGKTHAARLMSSQLLRLSTRSRKESKLADQINSVSYVLDSFGNSKTLLNPSASRHGRYTELHFTDNGRISGAKVLTFGLDKSRLSRLSHEERSFHVFYQLLAGATPVERDALQLEDPSDYALLASSGCYRLPGGPFSDDSAAMDELRASMKALGFKPKHIQSIFSLLLAILLLGNIQFADNGAKEVSYESATVVNLAVLDRVSALLGIPSEEFAQALSNKTNYIRKELYTVFLTADAASAQRDKLVQDLYAILFAFVTETVNHKISTADSPPPHTHIVLFDLPGFQSRGSTGSVGLTGPAPLVSAYGQNKFDEFCINFGNELLHSFLLHNTFDDATGYNSLVTSDGVPLPSINTMDNSACVELLRGAQVGDKIPKKPGGILGVMHKACSNYRQGKSSDKKDEDLLQDLVSGFGVHASFVTSPSTATGQQYTAADRMLFGINHYAGSCTYDIRGFVERDTDMLESTFVSLLRNSTDSFVAKLVSGPSMAAEMHQKDANIVVQAQVSSRPLRLPTSHLPRQSTESAELDPDRVYPVTTQLNSTLSSLLRTVDNTRVWNVACIRPNDSGSPNSFDKRRVKSQIRSLLLPDFLSRRKTDFVADVEHDEFCELYAPPSFNGTDVIQRIHAVADANHWRDGCDYAVGHRSVWLSFDAWKSVEDPIRAEERERRKALKMEGDDDDSILADPADDASPETHNWKGPIGGRADFGESADNLLRRTATGGTGHTGYYSNPSTPGYTGGDSQHPVMPSRGEGPFRDPSLHSAETTPKSMNDDPNLASKEGLVTKESRTIEEVPTSNARRWWLRFVWLMTWWIPSWCLSRVGKMKRPDVRLAWREKVTICLMIFFMCGIVIFYIIVFGRLLCPNFDRAWNTKELNEHQGQTDFWVAVAGEVYDISKFWQNDHSDITNLPATPDLMQELAGQDLTQYFPVPLSTGCPGLVSDTTLAMQAANFTIEVQTAVHTSGFLQANQGTKLDSQTWYPDVFLKAMNNYHKGPLVFTSGEVNELAFAEDRKLAFWNNELFDLSDYFNTIALTNSQNPSYIFFNSSVSDLFKQQAGQDISSQMNEVFAQLDSAIAQKTYQCLKNNFYRGQKDFRKTARCQVQNYLLLSFSIVIMTTIGAKFLAALQLSGKRTPEMLDKFVICQVPCYTEDEESLRRTIDSLAALKYDDKRKLMFIICDGNIIGSGNDRPTPRIVLDILGVDPKLDPEPLLFKSIGEGSKQLNYGKVYSGLYEFEGHVVPYLVVVKVGKPSERSRPGNRGKRDSQILLMHYLNRVHFDAPMSPLELEIYHQMRNVIGIDPAFYEYIFMVDADTSVEPDSLNRLVACTADDSKIIAICGETKLDNEEGSWWTMIQVYEYYISHHLSKAFESLFGSVTCLPGCFSMYRIRTADKGRPLIISNRVIEDYSEAIVDTLHKKNLLSLGEDRYLTTIMMKQFPTFKMKFTPDAVAHTIAPHRFSILLSQRRRWINSTIHNLVELIFLPELCGFCCFSMRFIVFIDLLGTIILPATTVYLIYLIVTVASGKAAIPIISLVMIAAVYGLQAIIFILKREFMLIGWMVIYILAYPVYSFFLPVYSFWCMDDFSWGNTRIVVGEGSNKKVIMDDDEKFDDSMIPLKKFSEYEAEAWEGGSHDDRKSNYSPSETGSKTRSKGHHNQTRSSSPRSFHPASQSGDFYRDTNIVQSQGSNPNLRNTVHNAPQADRPPTLAGLSQYGGGPSLPQLPFMPFGGGPPSAPGSDYGHGFNMGAANPGMGLMPSYTGSMYGMPGMAPPRNSVMTNLNMYGGGPGSLHGAEDLNTPASMGQQRPMSTFSMATTVNPFLSSTPSQNPDPTDEELLGVLRHYLSTQDLMTVTKKTAREAVMARFPRADLASRKEFLNDSIDRILSA